MGLLQEVEGPPTYVLREESARVEASATEMLHFCTEGTREERGTLLGA